MNTLRFSAALIGALTLAACETPMPEKGPVVPVQQILEANNGRIGCTGYDPATESCETIDRTVLTGSRWRGTALAAADVEGQILTFEVMAKGTVQDGKACMNGQDVRVSLQEFKNTEFAEIFENIMRAIYAQVGQVCSVYYAAGEDLYLVETYGPDGKLIPDGVDLYRFFDSQPKLRPLK